MSSKARFISLFFMSCLCFLMSAGATHSPGEKLSAPGPDDPKGSSGIPIAVTGTLIDGTGVAPVPDAVVVIEDGQITAAGPRKEVKIPANARILEFPGGTLLPGFINAHVHTMFDDKKLKAWAREGVTTVRDLAEAANLEWFALRDKLRADPRNARIVAAGPVFTCADGFLKEVSLVVSSPEDARAKVKALIDQGADVIKVGLNSPIYPELSPDVVKAIVDAAHGRGKPVAAHVISAQGMGVAVEAGVDDLSHMAPIGAKPEALIRQAKEKGIYWIPTFEPPRGDPPRQKVKDDFRLFLDLGGAVALGNDSGSMPNVQVGMPIKEILFMQDAGMTPMRIIEAATRQAARVCRLENEIGTLQPGKRADLLVVDGNPLEDLNALTKTRLVIHDGIIIRLE